MKRKCLCSLLVMMCCYCTAFGQWVVMPEIRINNPQVVSKSYPYYWEDLKKAVIDRRPQWNELEQRKDEEERCNEDIAPLCIADRAVLLWFCSHSNCPPDVHCPKQNGAGGISVRPAPFGFGSKGFQVPAALMRARPHRSARGTFP